MGLLDQVTDLVTKEDKEASAKESQRVALKEARDEALQALTHTLTDGSVLQTRPQDLANFQMTISLGVDQKWILEDNTVRLTSVAELETALNSGVMQAKAIWDQYATDLELLGG